ncbi:MAG: helix-turn-helix domain-containing protein [Candidatus Omnitrophica bacterium]|nr:helix-turn-helix domain-containing protein [Candidatus Omnitrophota bacterium]
MKQLLNVKELAEILNVPVSWIYQRTCMGPKSIPYYKMGKHIRFDIDEVKEFFKTEGKES